MAELVLLPVPRRLRYTEGVCRLEAGKRIALLGAPAAELSFAGQRLQTALGAAGAGEWALAATASGPAEQTGALLIVDPQQVRNAQGYELSITPQQIRVVARDAAGIFYGVCTLIQILEQTALDGTAELPCLTISDYPDFPARGVMLDISRDKVPTLETLLTLADMLASWKINQLQLYTEHTFTYRSHPTVWAEASPLSEQDILELDAYCRQRFIELVPNQNSFGHMHRWLKHPAYNHLAELPDYHEKRWWGTGPFSLCPLDPGSLALMQSLYDELLPNFTSKLFNVGADETFDLGLGRSKAECERLGTGRIYLDFLLKLYADVKRRGYTMQFWGDIIVEHPELIPELPKDMIALEWGYEANHPFAERSAQFAQAGVPFYVCPGTSTWNSIGGRTDNALGNLLNAAENGLKYGAIGYLNTDWGDNGHWHPLPVSYLGYAYGAALSWCLEANRQIDIVAVLNRFAFRDPSGSMGRVAYELGNVYQSLGPYFRNASGLARVLLMPNAHDEQALAEIRKLAGISLESFERAVEAIGNAMAPSEDQQMQRPDAALIMDEYELAANLLHHACGLGLLAFEDDPKVARPLRRKLRGDLKRLIEEYEQVWLARNHPGGLADSVARLEKIMALYE